MSNNLLNFGRLQRIGIFFCISSNSISFVGQLRKPATKSTKIVKVHFTTARDRVWRVGTLSQPFNEFVSNTRKNNDRNAVKIASPNNCFPASSSFFMLLRVFFTSFASSYSSLLLLLSPPNIRRFSQDTQTHQKKSASRKNKDRKICLCLISWLFSSGR